MKIQIRQGCFETNSSSTHAICIDNKYHQDEINEVFDKSWRDGIYYFEWGEYGRERATYYNVGDYLYTLAGQDDKVLERFKQKAEEYLESEGILVDFEEPKYNRWDDTGYVDHGHEIMYLVDWALESKENFFRCLFGHSYVETGNDNDDSYKEVEEEYNQCKYKTKFLK